MSSICILSPKPLSTMVAPCGGKGFGNAEANAAGRARHQRDAAFQRAHRRGGGFHVGGGEHVASFGLKSVVGISPVAGRKRKCRKRITAMRRMSSARTDAGSEHAAR